MSSLPTEQDLRLAAEQLISGSLPRRSQIATISSQYHAFQPRPAIAIAEENNPYTTDLSHSHSLNTIPSIRHEYVLSDDFLAGHRYNGSMSNVRRFFCLFVTFDLLFITLMWLLSLMVSGETVKDAIREEIIHYNIHDSLFDVVMAAISRFVVLLLFYACLYINHWIVIALSTAGTSAFLIAKVFLYDWDKHTEPVFKVMLVLISFVISWSEAWFLDFKVIPQEWMANFFLPRNQDVERAPLIHSYIDDQHGSMPPESVGNFYSPMESPTGSQFGDFEQRRLEYDQESLLKESAEFTAAPYAYSKRRLEKIKQKGLSLIGQAWNELNSPEWKLATTKSNGDKIYHRKIVHEGKMYKISGTIPFPPKKLFDELWENIEQITQWNRAVEESRLVQKISDQVDITYQVSAETAGGVMKKRDFVSLRSWDVINGVYLLANTSTTHPNAPIRSNFIRGQNDVGCWAIRAIETNANISQFEWVLNTPMRVWVPQYIIDTALTNILTEFMESIRSRTKEMSETKSENIISTQQSTDATVDTFNNTI